MTMTTPVHAASRLIMESPIGPLTLEAHNGSLTAVHQGPPGEGVVTTGPDAGDSGLLAEAVAQLDAYFAGERASFDLPVRSEGTDFQRRVWSALTEIPYGRTWSYGEVAARIGTPQASRAVGAACGRNPVAIVVPCHRVVGADGRLTGYGGGLARKRALLDLERAHRLQPA